MGAFFPFDCITVSVAVKMSEAHIFCKQKPQIRRQKIWLFKHTVYKIPVPLRRRFEVKIQGFSDKNKNIFDSVIERMKDSANSSNFNKIRFFIFYKRKKNLRLVNQFVYLGNFIIDFSFCSVIQFFLILPNLAEGKKTEAFHQNLLSQRFYLWHLQA